MISNVHRALVRNRENDVVERINLSVDEGVGDLLSELAGGERKRGQWLSDLVRAMHEAGQRVHVSDVEQMKMALAGIIGQQKMLEARVMRLERKTGMIGDE